MWTERGGNSSLQRDTPVTNRVQHTFQVTNLPLQYETIDAVNVQENNRDCDNCKKHTDTRGRKAEGFLMLKQATPVATTCHLYRRPRQTIIKNT